MRSTIISCLAALALVAGLVSCNALRPAEERPPSGVVVSTTPPAEVDTEVSGVIEVFVPCGMAGPYGEVKKLFQERYPNVKMELDLRNVDVQAAAIEDGKDHPDAWLTLGDIEMGRAVEAGVIDGEPVTFAYNSLALIVAKGNPCKIESLSGLLGDEVHTIALPSERNSSGHYIKKAFEGEGIWEALQPKVWSTDQPSMVKVQLGNGKADVGVVYFPCAKEAKRVGGEPENLPQEIEMLGELDEAMTGRIAVQAAVVKGAKNPELGRLFVEFLLEEPCQDAWENWDFGRAVERASGAPDARLHLYCGAGIRPFAEPVIEAFQEKNPGIRVEASYAGSGCLLSQLTFAKRGDLYMPGEDFYLDQARKRDFIAYEELIGYFEPVILVAEGNPKSVETLEDLTRKDVKIGLCEPEIAAVGVAARDLLQEAGLYESVLRKDPAHAGNVPELGNWVQLGTLDAAIVWNVTAAQIQEETDSVEIPREYWEPSEIYMGVLTFTKHPEAAKAFVDFCASEEGQAIAAQKGLASRSEGADA